MTTSYIKEIYMRGDHQQAVDLLRVEKETAEVVEILYEWEQELKGHPVAKERNSNSRRYDIYAKH